MSTGTSGRILARPHRDRPPYLHVVPMPGPVTPATPCPPWCIVEHEDCTDTFHYGEGLDIGTATVFPEIREDGSHAVQIGLNGVSGEFFNLTEIDELISALAAVRAVLTGSESHRDAVP